jgi:hypothetical protein
MEPHVHTEAGIVQLYTTCISLAWAGASLVPVISFGENELFDAKVVGPDTPFGRFQL